MWKHQTQFVAPEKAENQIWITHPTTIVEATTTIQSHSEYHQWNHCLILCKTIDAGGTIHERTSMTPETKQRPDRDHVPNHKPWSDVNEPISVGISPVKPLWPIQKINTGGQPWDNIHSAREKNQRTNWNHLPNHKLSRDVNKPISLGISPEKAFESIEDYTWGETRDNIHGDGEKNQRTNRNHLPRCRTSREGNDKISVGILPVKRL